MFKVARLFIVVFVLIIALLVLANIVNIEYRASGYSKEVRPHLRAVLYTLKKTELWGGYWNNKMVEQIEDIASNSPKYRAEFYISLIENTPLDVDGESAYDFDISVFNDKEGMDYFIQNHYSMDAYKRLNKSDQDSVGGWAAIFEFSKKNEALLKGK